MTKDKIYSWVKQKIPVQWRSDSSVNSILKNMIFLATGNGLSRVIAFITTPIITRIYLPEHFGVLSVFSALIIMFMPFGTLLYTLAIPLPKNDGAATNLVIFCGMLLLIISSLIFLLLWLFAAPLLNMLSMNQLLPYWWLLPLGVAGAGFYELLSNWAIRMKAFKPLAKTLVWQSIIGHAVKIGLGAVGLRPLGLLIGHIFTQAGGILSLLRNFYKKLKSNLRFVSRKRMIFMLKRYSDFPKYRLPSQIALVLSSKAPLLFFAWHFDAETTGQLGLAFTLIALPISLFGRTTGKAYYAEIAKIGRKNSKNIFNVTKSITKKLFLLSFPPFIILLLFGPWLFKIIFGDIWHEAGIFASILALYLLTQFIYVPLENGVANVFEKQAFVLLVKTIRLILVLSVFLTTFLLDLGPNNSLFLYSIVMTLQYIVATFIVFRIIKKQINLNLVTE